MLQTERLILRRWEESDAENLYQYAKKLYSNDDGDGAICDRYMPAADGFFDRADDLIPRRVHAVLNQNICGKIGRRNCRGSFLI